MLVNGFDLVFPRFYRLGKSPKCPFKYLYKTGKIELEPNFIGLRDAPLIVVAHWNQDNWDLKNPRDAELSRFTAEMRLWPSPQCTTIVVSHWKLTIGKLGFPTIQSHHVIPLVGTWTFSAMRHYHRVPLEFENCEIDPLRDALSHKKMLFYD